MLTAVANWLWALEGWQFIAGTLTCLVSMIGTFIGAIGWIAKTIEASTEHDKETCGCEHCLRIRRKSIRPVNPPFVGKGHWGTEKNSNVDSDEWLTTNQLEEQMLLKSKGGNIYRVEQLFRRDYGVALHLRNMATNQLAWVTVNTARLDTPMWRRETRD